MTDQNVVKFPTKPRNHALGFRMQALVRQKMIEGVSTERLKALWDEYDGTNEPGGWDGEEIHAELNRRGEGDYCPV